MHRMGVSLRVVSLFLFTAALTVWSSPAAEAQYFGRNKVEYQTFDYRVLRTEHFDIYYDRRDERSVHLAARMAERWYERLSTLFDHELSTRQPLVLYGSHPAFGQTNIVPGQLDEGVGGVTESGRRRIAMPFAASLAHTHHVLGHEIVHAFQFDIAKRHRISRGFPLWFAEGMAEYLAGGPRDDLTAAWVRDALEDGGLPGLDELNRTRRHPYRFGHAFWAWLVSAHGEAIVPRMLRDPPSGKVLDRLAAATGRPVAALSEAWERDVRELLGLDAERSEVGDTIVTSRAGRLNIAPAISPDGKRIAFLSERDRFSIDLFVGDVGSGAKPRKLLTSTHDVELEALQYVNSAGAWRPDGRQLAFAAIRRGAPVLLLIDPDSGRRDREVRLPQLGEVLTPTWSPDGRSIAFAALDGGVSDLFVYDLANDALRRLTNDAFSDLQPAWSPDGRRLAFATDRFSTDLEALSFGPLQLAMLDLETLRIEPVPALPDAKAINPQWGDRGRALYFVADPHGISDVFRIDLVSGDIHRVTAVTTGVSGLTSHSPALSVAGDAETVAFSMLRRGRYQIQALTPDDVGQGSGPAEMNVGQGSSPAEMYVGQGFSPALSPVCREFDCARLAPDSPGGSRVAATLADASSGLPPSGAGQSAVYRPKLGFDGILQPYVSSGSTRFGSYVRAGASLLFDDFMGEQLLGVTWQAGSRIYDLGLDVRYLNRSSRWNWGVLAELKPLVRYRSLGTLADRDGRPVLEQDTDLHVQTSTRFGGFLAYPFSRARRVEFGGAVRHIDFSRELRSQDILLPSGRRLRDDRIDLPAPDDVLLAETSVAFVHDNAQWGATSPRLGSRWRVEAMQTTGQLSYTTLGIDYRRYFMPVRSVTLAARLAPSLRLGSDAEDPRLFPMYAGSRVPVRGYYGRTLTASCAALASEGCVPGDDLFGHRLVAANVEVRVPFTPLRSATLPLHAEAIAFVDAAFLWSRGYPSFTSSAVLQQGLALASDAESSGLRQHRIRTIGFGVRFNALGLLLEIDAIKPLDRVRNGWAMGVFATPGF